MKKTPEYTLHDSDDEEDDTVETRKSVKTAEKALRKRFFINAKEERDYKKAMDDGTISEKQLDFKEDDDEELGPVNHYSKVKQAEKKKAKVAKILKKRADAEAAKHDHRTAEEKKADAEAKEKEDEIAAAKEDREDNAAPKPPKKVEPPKVEAPPTAPTPADLPPELAGALGQGDLPPELAGALAQKKQRRALVQQRAFESESDSDSSDSDSDSGDDE